MAPAVNIVTHAQNFGLNNRAAPLLGAKISAGQEHLTNRNQLVHRRLVTCAADLIVKERRRDLHVNTSAVASLTIRIDSTTVPNGLERVNALFDNRARRLALDRNHKANATRAMLILSGIKAILGHPLALRLFGLNPVLIKCGHWNTPAIRGLGTSVRRSRAWV